MAKTNYVNHAQQRVLQTLTVLVDRGPEGALPGEIAEAIGTIASNTTRDLANLRHAGFGRSIDGRWYSSVPGGAPANAVPSYGGQSPQKIGNLPGQRVKPSDDRPSPPGQPSRAPRPWARGGQDARTTLTDE